MEVLNFVSQKEGMFPLQRMHSLQILDKNNMSIIINEAEKNINFEKNISPCEISSERVDNLNKSVVNCLVCFDKPPDAVFMECGHGGVCYECSLEVWKNTGECFLCRKVRIIDFM